MSTNNEHICVLPLYNAWLPHHNYMMARCCAPREQSERSHSWGISSSRASSETSYTVYNRSTFHIILYYTILLQTLIIWNHNVSLTIMTPTWYTICPALRKSRNSNSLWVGSHETSEWLLHAVAQSTFIDSPLINQSAGELKTKWHHHPSNATTLTSWRDNHIIPSNCSPNDTAPMYKSPTSQTSS